MQEDFVEGANPATSLAASKSLFRMLSDNN